MKARRILPVFGLAFCVTVLPSWATATRAAHSVAHTHIGVNPTWRPAHWDQPAEGAIDPDPTDDNKLWFFSVPPADACATPGWPNWKQTTGRAFLVLTPVMEAEEHIAKPGDPNKVLYTCSFTYSRAGGYGDPNGLQHLDGWHSAHGPQAAWNLESIDELTVPSWDIYLRREHISSNLDADDCFALLHDDTPALENDGEVFFLQKQWLFDKNAWGLHEHMGFYFWLNEDDEEVDVVLSAHDAGGLYQRSAEFAIHFARTIVHPVPGDLNADGIVDVHDLEILVEHWGFSGIFSGDDQDALDHNHTHEN